MNLNLAEEMAITELGYYGLFQQGWSFKFDRSVSRLGYCNFRNKIISLGQHATLVNDEVTVRNTILHEVAHALCGYHEGHGPIWKTKCLEIGGDGKRLGHIAVKAPHKYQMFCNDCNRLLRQYYRKPKLGPCYIHKCSALLQRIGYVSGQPWQPIASNLLVKEAA